MNKHSMTFIGLDTHKEFHEVAYCEEPRGATPVHYGRIPSSKDSAKYTNMPVLFIVCAIDFAIKGEVDSNTGLYSASTRRFRYLRYHHHRNCRGLTTLHKHACLV